MGIPSSSVETTSKKIPVVPGALPIVGHILDYMPRPLAFMEFATSWGPMVEVRLGPLNALVLREPVDIERLVVGEYKRLTKDKTTLTLRRILGDGLLTSEGETWQRHRKLISPIFQPSSVAGLGSIMVDVTERHLQHIECGSTRELHSDMTHLTADIVTAALFATELGSQSAKVGPALEVLVEHYGHGFAALFPILDHIPLPSNKRARAALQSLDNLVMDIVERARKQNRLGSDLLSMLLAARDDGGKGFGDKEVRDHLMTFFLAGHETTALALTFAFVLLSKHPDVEKRLRDELSSVLGDKLPAVGELPRLPYARAVILETMRLYPPAWAIGREAIEDFTLSGYRIPKGAQLWMSQWVNHRDSRYFPEPQAFRPERWLGGLERSLPRFAYYPFGGGTRICIGNHFAMMEAVLTLVTLLRRFRIRLVNPEAPIDVLATITLRPKKRFPVVYEELLK